jgi:hypothetical protein
MGRASDVLNSLDSLASIIVLIHLLHHMNTSTSCARRLGWSIVFFFLKSYLLVLVVWLYLLID